MALGVPGFVKIGAAIAGCAMVAACTPQQPPAVTPTPSPSPTPSVSTPVETEIERQMRLDFEAAERAYRANIAEQDRLSKLGVARSTEILENTSTGRYLEFALLGLRDIERSGWRAVGDSKIVGVTQGGWQERRLHLTACEDGTAIRFFDKTGRDVTPKNAVRTFIQDLTVVKIGTHWKVSDIESKGVKSFDGASCAS